MVPNIFAKSVRLNPAHYFFEKKTKVLARRFFSFLHRYFADLFLQRFVLLLQLAYYQYFSQYFDRLMPTKEELGVRL